MRLYDFSAYKKERDTQRAAEAVAALGTEMHRPGSVIEMKRRLSLWLDLYKEACRRKA